MNAMDIDQATGHGIKRKADESPPHAADFESKRLKPTDTESQHRASSTQNHRKEQQSPSSTTHSPPIIHEPSPTTTSITTNPQPNLTKPKQPTQTLQLLRREFHTLNKNLVKKRDNFFIDGDYYDRLADLYGDLSEIVQAAPWRTDINEWVENLCVMLLDVFIRLEDEKREIDGIEGRLWEILVELGGVV